MGRVCKSQKGGGCGELMPLKSFRLNENGKPYGLCSECEARKMRDKRAAPLFKRFNYWLTQPILVNHEKT